MTIVRMHNKKTGITYVYESTSYWDKEKKQPRNERRLIGKIDPVTGEIVPTGRPGRKKAPASADAAKTEQEKDMAGVLASKDAEIAALKTRAIELEIRCRAAEDMIARIRTILGERRD